jgi:hypothetical protein
MYQPQVKLDARVVLVCEVAEDTPGAFATRAEAWADVARRLRVLRGTCEDLSKWIDDELAEGRLKETSALGLDFY